MIDLEISGDERSEENLPNEPVLEKTGVDEDPPQPSPAVKNALDSQGFVNDSDPPTVCASRPSPPESMASETTPAPATIIPEVVALDSPEPPNNDLGSAAADAADAASASETSAAAGPSAEPIPVPVNPVPAVRKILGRRAPALLTEPINFLSRVRTSPVLVTSRPRSTSDVATSSADATEEDMDTSSTLERKPMAAKEKQGRKKGKK